MFIIAGHLLEKLWDDKSKIYEITKTKKEFKKGDPDPELLVTAHIKSSIALLVAYGFENFLRAVLHSCPCVRTLIAFGEKGVASPGPFLK